MSEKQLIEYYINKYHPNCKGDAEKKKNEINKVKQLIQKLLNKTTIYKDLPFEVLSTEEQSKLLNHLLEDTADREIVSNMSKSDVNRSYYNFITDNEDNKTKLLIEELHEYKPYDIKEGIKRNRDSIRNLKNISLLLKDLLAFNEVVRSEIFDERSMYHLLGLEYKNMDYIRDYIEYVTDGLLQIINYHIVNDTRIEGKEKFFISILSKLEELSGLLDKQINRIRQNQANSEELTAEEITRYFAFYRTQQSQYDEYIDIINILIDEVDKDANIDDKERVFKPLQEKYRARKLLLTDSEIDGAEKTITEGRKIYDYKNKLTETRKIIEIFGKYGGRSCYSNCLQDIKVFFREIFMSKQGYRGKIAISIVRDYLATCESQGVAPFENQAHYMFIREKISRGYFREKGLMSEYILKSKVQRELYTLMLKTYLFYDYETILHFIYEVNYHMLKMVSELFAE